MELSIPLLIQISKEKTTSFLSGDGKSANSLSFVQLQLGSSISAHIRQRNPRGLFRQGIQPQSDENLMFMFMCHQSKDCNFKLKLDGASANVLKIIFQIKWMCEQVMRLDSYFLILTLFLCCFLIAIQANISFVKW